MSSPDIDRFSSFSRCAHCGKFFSNEHWVLSYHRYYTLHCERVMQGNSDALSCCISSDHSYVCILYFTRYCSNTVEMWWHVLLLIFRSVCQWKNFTSQSVISRDMDKSLLLFWLAVWKPVLCRLVAVMHVEDLSLLLNILQIYIRC